MPVIDLYLPEGALSLEAERDLAERITADTQGRRCLVRR
jgi:phenylpyruvate tautomerase PptA (4-oxalocrotonate tautomerase family)